MANILHDLAEALAMAGDLSFMAALPIYGIAYALFLWALAVAVRAWMKVFGK